MKFKFFNYLVLLLFVCSLTLPLESHANIFVKKAAQSACKGGKAKNCAKKGLDAAKSFAGKFKKTKVPKKGAKNLGKGANKAKKAKKPDVNKTANKTKSPNNSVKKYTKNVKKNNVKSNPKQIPKKKSIPSRVKQSQVAKNSNSSTGKNARRSKQTKNKKSSLSDLDNPAMIAGSIPAPKKRAQVGKITKVSQKSLGKKSTNNSSIVGATTSKKTEVNRRTNKTNLSGSKDKLNNRSVAQYARHATKNPNSNTVVLGRYKQSKNGGPTPKSYNRFAENKNATYYDMGTKRWSKLENRVGATNTKELFKPNKKFIDNQVKANKRILFSQSPNNAKGFLKMEVDYLKSKYGFKFRKVKDGWEAFR